MDNIVMKICKILIIICIICIFIISPLLDAYACSDEDIVCMFVSYMNSEIYYGKYITVYEGIHIIDDIEMYVFTDLYTHDGKINNYITYALYIDGCNIIYYDEIGDIYNYLGLENNIDLPYTAIVIRDDTSVIYYRGDVYEC